MTDTMTFRIEQELDAYQSFYDHDWARHFGSLAKEAGLDDIFFALIATWKSAANTSRLPWLMNLSMENFAKGYSTGQKSHPAQFLDAVRDLIINKTEPPLNKQQQLSIVKHIFSTNEQLSDAIANDNTLNEEYWKFLIQDSEFQIAIIGTQRMCYSDIFFAYENFSLQIAMKIHKDSTIRTTDRKPNFASKLDSALCPESGDTLWTCEDVQRIRRIRNCLVHQGGKADPSLTSDPKVDLENGYVQITVSNNRELMDFLKIKVSKIINFLKTNPQK